MLADRPPISIPLSTISPALLEELTNEISTLASVYHKPVEAFIGRGRLGADELAKKGAAAAQDLEDESNAGATAGKAIQVVAQGQRSENLLDFGLDDEDPQGKNTLGMAFQAHQAALAKNGLGGLDFGAESASTGAAAAAAAAAARVGSSKPSANPLDDLLGLFDSAGLGPGSAPVGGAGGGGGGASTGVGPSGNTNGGFGGLGSSMASPPHLPTPSSQSQQQKKTSDIDLMGDLF